MTSYSELSPHSRVWIYQSDRRLTNDEVALITTKLTGFVNNWTAHNRPLKAFAEVRENLFILIYVDESESIISGCGIDKSFHLVESLGHDLNIDFFNRTKVAYISNNIIHLATLLELKGLYNEKGITDTTIIFNNVVQTKNELETSWKIPLVNSWASKLVSTANKLKVN